MASDAEGIRAVAVAREAIEVGLTGDGSRPDVAARFRSAELPTIFDEPRGVFVTLTEARGGALRGCIGFPLPVYPLRIALPRAAWSAAVEDPRFPPVTASELPRTLVEVSILTVPEEMPAGPELPRNVRIGRDGLIVDRNGLSGLLLPQVASEEGWDPTRFLSEACRKAGLRAGAWREPGTFVRRFQAELFRERTPGGPAERHTL